MYSTSSCLDFICMNHNSYNLSQAIFFYSHKWLSLLLFIGNQVYQPLYLSFLEIKHSKRIIVTLAANWKQKTPIFTFPYTLFIFKFLHLISHCLYINLSFHSKWERSYHLKVFGVANFKLYFHFSIHCILYNFAYYTLYTSFLG